MPSTDTDELAKFGYKQELDRSLGLFSSFAAGFSYISIMTGVFTLLIILLAAHIRRGPGVVLDTFGLGAGYPWGYFGAFLVAGLMSAYVMYGFDTAGSLAEETLDPRKNAPPAILRAVAAAGLAGFLVILLGEMSVPDIHAKELGTSGLPYLVKATLGGTVGNVFLIDSLIAITVCSLAVHAGGIRMIFTMGRDGRLPFASAIAKVHGRSKTPLVPSIVIGVITILLLVLNVGNQRAFFVLTSVAIIMFYIAYLCVTGPLLIARLRGKWPSAEHGRYFSLGAWW
jgi:amino acid transporter